MHGPRRLQRSAVSITPSAATGNEVKHVDNSSPFSLQGSTVFEEVLAHETRRPHEVQTVAPMLRPLFSKFIRSELSSVLCCAVTVQDSFRFPNMGVRVHCWKNELYSSSSSVPKKNPRSREALSAHYPACVQFKSFPYVSSGLFEQQWTICAICFASRTETRVIISLLRIFFCNLEQMDLKGLSVFYRRWEPCEESSSFQL